MTNLIIGAGLLGLTTAFELIKRGQDVSIVDTEHFEGMGTSFANGGLLTPSMSDPWNAPGVHRNLVQYILGSSSAIKIRWSALPSLLFWGPKFLSNSRSARFRTATTANHELGTYSLAVLDDLRAELDLRFDASDKGTLKFFRSSRAFEAVMEITEQLRALGLQANELDRDATIRLEPCLSPIADQLVGAIHYPSDKSGDAHLFCRALAEEIKRRGGMFHFGREVRSIDLRNGKVAGVVLDQGTLPADKVIVAAGTASAGLVARLGLRLSIKPVKGYSITYTPEVGVTLPTIPVVDDAYHAAVTPLGARLRSVGTAEFAGYNRHLDQSRLDNLTSFIRAIYPDVATPGTLATGRPWAGLRPVAADGRPYIGSTAIPGLWINSGHGHLGWTLAAGSARLLADLMTGAKPDIAAEPYRVAR